MAVKGHKEEKTLLLEKIKANTEDLLKKHGEYKEFHNSKIYIMSPDKVKIFNAMDEELSPYKKNTVKGKAYSIDKIVNLINPNQIAYQYEFVLVEKYPFVSDLQKCINYAKESIEVNANTYRKETETLIEANPQWNEEFVQKMRDEVEKKIEKERAKITQIDKNPDTCKKMRISGFKHKLTYGQVNWGYYRIENGVKIKVRTNKHLSVNYPNVIFFEPDVEADKHRRDMEAKYLERSGFVEISRNVFVKYNKGAEL